MTGPPLDHGWAWACVLGNHVTNMVIVGVFKSLGILIVEFTDEFNAPLATATVLFAFLGGFMSILAPLGTALGERYTNRAVVLTGVAFIALASFLTSFANSIVTVVLVFGILTGIGYGFVFGPANIVIGLYFRNRRSLAIGIAVAGGSVGQLLFPLLFRKLIDEYTWRGALFIYSALSLNMAVGAMLFRPLSFYAKKKSGGQACEEKTLQRDNTSTENVVDVVEKGNVKLNSVAENRSDKGCEDPKQLLPSESIRTPVQSRKQLDCGLASNDNVSPAISRRLIDGGFKKSSVSLNLLEVKIRETDSHHAQDYKNSPRYASAGSLCFYPYPEIVAEGGIGESGEGQKTSFLDVLKVSFCMWCIKKDTINYKESLFDWSLFRNRLYLLYIVAVGLGNTGFLNLFLFIPKLSEDQGFNRQSSALLISICGICDLVSRVAGGWFADLGYIKRSNIMAFTILFTGVSTFIFPHIKTYGGLVTYMVIVGTAGGYYASLMLAVLIDFVGLERTPKAFGMTIMVMGIFNIPMPVVLGYLRDVTGNCLASFSLCAVFMTLAGILLSLEPIVRPLEDRRQETKS